MSEGKSVSQLTNELGTKTGASDYYLLIEQENATGDPTSYKIKLGTILSGILIPDGLGDIDVDNNNLINVNQLDAVSIKSGVIIDGTDRNKIFCKGKAEYASASGFSIIYEQNIDIETTYIKIPKTKIEATILASLIDAGSGAPGNGTITIKLVKHTPPSTDADILTLFSDTMSSDNWTPEKTIISDLIPDTTFGASDELRLVVSSTFSQSFSFDINIDIIE